MAFLKIVEAKQKKIAGGNQQWEQEIIEAKLLDINRTTLAIVLTMNAQRGSRLASK